ncbi:copper transporter [Gleimia hominis]|uniref:copper transporter n=1 Tax=Gleimia hominis TaxID=595468 RepID=UPI000C80E6B1|nr:copper transporter [Gleimia hominis]WIK65265.1 copper transporter [Gleimia hominis]
MVDFRYHLVSLISVFLALALGVVLGAGPLQTPIASGLTGQVESLRETQTKTTAQIEQAHADIANRNDWIDEAARQLLPNKLKGVNVAVVSLPQTRSEDVDAVRSYVEVAGGKVNQTAALTDNWTAGGMTQFRASLSSPIAEHLSGDDLKDAGSAQIFGQALTQVLTDDSEDSKLIREMLTDKDNALVQFDQDTTKSEAILLVGPVRPEAGEEPTPTPTGPNAEPDTSMLTQLGTAIAKAPKSGVVLGQSATKDGLVSVLRDEGAVVTTVDGVGSAMGNASAVLALVSAGAQARAFGQGNDVNSAMPPLP